MLEQMRMKRAVTRDVVGELCFPPAVLETFLRAPRDMLPTFTPPPGRERKPSAGRGKDHPRYGRFTYAFAKELRPELVVEVGTFAGGTSVGWGTALVENGAGRLICVDNDCYAKGTYPEIARRNIEAVGLPADRFELRNGDARELVPALAEELRGRVDVYLVDADHTFEGATADIEEGLPMVKPGGYLLVHDIDRDRKMAEATPEHPHPVYEAFMNTVERTGHPWCILKFIRKHLGILRVA